MGTGEFPSEDMALADGNQCAQEGSVHFRMPCVPMASEKMRDRTGAHSYRNIERALRINYSPRGLKRKCSILGPNKNLSKSLWLVEKL